MLGALRFVGGVASASQVILTQKNHLQFRGQQAFEENALINFKP
jgi:hypothetical protein